MGLYEYRAIDAEGVLRTGQLEAGAREAVLAQLQQRGLVAIDVAARTALAATRGPLTHMRARLVALLVAKRLRSRELVSLTRSLAALLNAGLTVDRALSIAASLEHGAAARLLADLARTVRAGSSFTEALRTAAADVPPYYLSLVDAGELGGSLPQTLSRAAELLHKSLSVKERIQAALIYPLILACVVLGTLIILLTFVLPRFRTLFEQSEAALPWPTRAVLGVGEAAAQHGGWLLALLVCGLIAARQYAASAAGRQRVDRWLLHSRLTFGLPAAIDTARMLRTLSTLLANGVALPAALRIARGTLANTCLRAALTRVMTSVSAGQGFAIALAEVRCFPSEAVQLARVGEEAGRLQELLLEAAAILDSNSERLLERLLTLLVPALTILMGLVVAALIGSVLIGLLSINDLAF